MSEETERMEGFIALVEAYERSKKIETNVPMTLLTAIIELTKEIRELKEKLTR